MGSEMCIRDSLWIVTSPDAVAVMDTYALVKTLLSRQRLIRPIELIVTGADQSIAQDVHRRVDQSCRRFLGLPVNLAGWTPRLTPQANAATTGVPHPTSRFADSIAPLLQFINNASAPPNMSRAA